MKIVYFIIITIFGYFGFIGFFFIHIKYFTFHEVDLDKNGILTISELSYFLSTGEKYKFYTKEKGYQYFDYNNDFSSLDTKDIVLEIFSLKDGLILKEIKLGKNIKM